MDFITALDSFNAFAWVTGNVLLAVAMAFLIIFMASYAILFDYRVTTGGRLIFRFMTSLIGVLVLVFIGIFLDAPPGREWFVYNSDVVGAWRPILRLAFYSYLTYTIVRLYILLIMRKWFPERVRKASDIELVKPRTRDVPTTRKS